MVFVVNYARPDQDSRTKRPRRSLSSPEEAPEATRTQSALLFRKVFASSIRQKCVLFLLRPMTTHRENRCAESEKISIPLAQNCNSPGEEVDSPFSVVRRRCQVNKRQNNNRPFKKGVRKCAAVCEQHLTGR
ncbi:hypothetical protein L596_000296 [Steinernema carpocapsae]|uniref:Uncharacterized protein n=1 Tax=Steinernema carpocapsae TaxID=34508 RepID=A0A4U8UK56_STECR|nr:hypothetical protein L596_000296 [Steinernema carpocapsae]